jgi:tetratricopeptide (TPR) repeat protein
MLLAAIVLAALLSYFSIRNALAAGALDLATAKGYQRAARLEPSNPQNWYLLGRQAQYNLESPDPQRAISAYRTALALDPRSADAWLDLATAYESEDQLQQARDAFLRAKRAYPLSAQVAWRYGNFLLRQGELPQAFVEIRSAAYVDPKRGGEAFSRVWRVKPDIDFILNNILPPNRDVYLDVIRELSESSQLPPALTVWNRLVALHPALKLREIFFFTDALAQNQLIADASRVWNEAVPLSDTPPPADPAGSVLWDGGFETGVIGGDFAWHLSAPEGGEQTTLDSREKHSGRQSLRIVFDGKHNVNFAGVSHIVQVQPGVPYRLSAWIRTQALTTDEGIHLQIYWLEGQRAASVSTPSFSETQPWTLAEVLWTPGKDVHSARIALARSASAKLDSNIQGTAWIDDVALVPVSAESHTP